MELFWRVDINIVATVFSAGILAFAARRLDKSYRMNRAFLILGVSVVAEITIETITCLINGRPNDALMILSIILHTILYMAGPFIPYLWCVFICCWLSENCREPQKGMLILSAPFIANAAFTIYNLFSPVIFSVSADNVYMRGPAFFIPMLTAYFYLTASAYLIVKNRKALKKDIFTAFFIFDIFTIAGGIIQSIFYGVLLMWSSAAFALVAVYIFIQQRLIQYDTLTGAWSKQTFDLFSRSEQKDEMSGVIFIDLDNLKQINNNYGHLEGDAALEKTVYLIKQALRKNDIIARFGGDEFVIVARGADEAGLKRITEMIKTEFDDYNNTLEKPYRLEYSLGCDVFKPSEHRFEAFLRHVDMLMYKNKAKKKSVI